MKVTNKNRIKISKSEWEAIGKQTGWFKKAEEEMKTKGEEINKELEKIRESLAKIEVPDNLYALNDGSNTKFLSLSDLMDYFETYFHSYSDQFPPSVRNVKTRKALLSKGGEPTTFLEIDMNVWPFYVDMPSSRFMIASAEDVKKAHGRK